LNKKHFDSHPFFCWLILQSPNEPLVKLPISAVLITLNAASQLAASLASLQFCEEILIVDSGSTDDTLAIAQEYGATVKQHAWLGFGPQKAWGVSHAKFDWLLCIDSDEIVSDTLKRSIEHAILNQSEGKDVYSYQMPRSNFFLNRYLRHGEGYPDWSLRLFHRHHAQWSDDAVHEKVISKVPIRKLKGDLLHHSAESMHDYITKQNRYTTLAASELFQRRKNPSALKIALAPVIRFVKFYFIKQGYRDGLAGFVHICIGCFNTFLKHAKTRSLFEQAIHRTNQNKTK
jgi:glycosyltransferase involved in cell wall biosynthesis